MQVRFRPLGLWPVEFTPLSTQADRFKAPFSDTLRVLEHELLQLGSFDVVIEAGFRERDIRLDGWPRSDARQPDFPGVIINFDSDHGPLRYGTAMFRRWQSNLRAIALGLEALRKVDRYGISQRGEQYTGWKALPAGGNQERAQRGRILIEKHGSVRAAERATHPDVGGNDDDFAAVQAAKAEGAG